VQLHPHLVPVPTERVERKAREPKPGVCSLLKPSGWRTLARIFREIQQARVTVDKSPCVHFEEATVQTLISMLRSSNQSVSRPKVFVGVMRFPCGSLPLSLDDHFQVEDADTPAEPPSSIGDAFSLRLDLLDHASGVAHSSVSENPTDLTLHFSWQSNDLHVALRDDGLPPDAFGPEALEAFHREFYSMLTGRQGGQKIVTLDFAACSSAMTFHHRSVFVIVNGPWTLCNTGLFEIKAGTAIAVDALALGVPCVVCARHAQVTDVQPTTTFVSVLV